jgi:CPA1 family monovalent cation:H+ antiporter
MIEIFHIISFILLFCAVFAYLNVKYFRLPATIGLMIAGLVISVLLLASSSFQPIFFTEAREALLELDFSSILLEGMLSFLLFAGALHTDLEKLKSARGPVMSFATIGVIMATFMIGGAMFFIFRVLGMEVPIIYCLLFGALISPTDPIAVMGTLKKARVPKILETKIVGESLFNDGIGVVVFLTLFQVAKVGVEEVTAGYVAHLFLVEVGGGIALGAALGFGALQLMKRIDEYKTEVLITLAVVMGGYSIAHMLHVSGPLAMVVAGLLVGNYGEEGAMSGLTADYVNKFWEIVDEILNALLFVLIGLELIIVDIQLGYIIAGLVAAIVVLAIRYTSLWTTSHLFGFKKTFLPNTLKIMTWGGLRGGISVALALSLEPYMAKELLVTVTYIVVLLSLVGQGLTVGNFIKRFDPTEINAS